MKLPEKELQNKNLFQHLQIDMCRIISGITNENTERGNSFKSLLKNFVEYYNLSI